MSTKTRVIHVRVVGFSAPERQMLNSIFLLSVAPARQIGYKLWNPEAGIAPDMYLLDGDSDSAVASWQATFASTADRTLVVGGKNIDLGVASASRPLGLKVVGAMDRLSIALNNAREPVGHDVSAPGASLPTMRADESGPAGNPRHNVTLPRPASPPSAPSMSASMSSMAPLSTNATTMAASTHAIAASSAAPVAHVGTLPTSMTSAAPAATVLPNMMLQPNVAPTFDRSLNEKTVNEKTVDKILSDKPAVDKPAVERPAVEKPVVEKTAAEKINAAAALIASGVTPLSAQALSAAVAPSPARANLRVVPNPASLAASLPSSARIADTPLNAPMAPPPAAPVAAAPAPAPVIAPPLPVMPVAVPTPRHEEHNFRVLAVDDSPLMRTFLQNKLAPYGIQPEFASSGEEALFKISKQHFDMIFLDVMLPGMDGYDVCKMIKKNKDNSLMKVVMLTSKDRTFDKIRGTMAGCDGYLTKPVDEMKLRAIIERHTVTKK